MIRIKGWEKHQSYKDRKPPWIRLHKSILDDYDFHSMSAEARALLPMLWLLASEDEDPVSGLLRFDYRRITFRLRMSYETFENALNEILSVKDDSGQQKFIEIVQPIENKACNETVMDSYSNRTETVTPETETETETERAPADGKAIRSLDDLASHPLDGHYENWFREKAPGIDRFDLRDRMISYCRAKNKKYADYWAALQNWARDAQGKLPAASPAKRKANDENAAYLADLQKRMEGRVNVSGAI